MDSFLLDVFLLDVFLLLLATGAFTGVIAGLLGIGGGIIIVPVLASVFTYQAVDPQIVMHAAIGTSLATIVFTSLSSIQAHHRKKCVNWKLFFLISPGVVLGSFIGGTITQAMSSQTLRPLFAVFMLFVAAQLLMGKTSKPSRSLPGKTGLTIAGMVIGIGSGIFGIGGSTMSVPFLTWCNVKIREAIGTACAISFSCALSGAASYIYWGWSFENLPAWHVGYVNLLAVVSIIVASVLSAQYGVRLAHATSEKWLKRIFALLLVSISIKMFLG